ncbi:MAG: hypothetical protein ABR973_07965 [Candidatus Acidiferrales bacterium]|jgi:hypothetical protein
MQTVLIPRIESLVITQLDTGNYLATFTPTVEDGQLPKFNAVILTKQGKVARDGRRLIPDLAGKIGNLGAVGDANWTNPYSIEGDLPDAIPDR